MKWICGRYVLLAMAILAPATRGEESKQQQYAQWAKDERERGQNVRDDYAQLATELGRLDGFVKDDLPKMSEAYEAWAKSFEVVAAAWDRGDEKEASRLRQAIGNCEQIALVWRMRLWEYRRRQAEAAPDEQWYRDTSRWGPKGAMPEFDALALAKRANAEAWGRVAEATVPGADENVIFELREKAFAADAEREIADWRFRWATEREWVWSDKKISSEELKQTLAALRRFQDQRVALKRTDIARDRHLREIERDMHRADARFHKAWDTAREAYYKTQR